MPVAVSHTLSDSQTHWDLGEAFLEKRDHDRIARNLTRRQNNLGFAVELRAAAYPSIRSAF